MHVYVGITGILNQKIIGHRNVNFDRFISARQFKESDISELNIKKLCWAGRNIPNENILMKLQDVKCTFISTYIYNDFTDAYQSKKIQDEMVVKNYGWNIIRIPFIGEMLPSNVELLLNRDFYDGSGYYINITNLSDILNTIYSNEVLETKRVYLRLALREKILWKVFSCLYSMCNIPQAKLSVTLRQSVKLIEKTLHRLLKAHCLSSVFIGKNGK